MRTLSAALVVAAAIAVAQIPPTVEFHHLYTFGSKLGIHPPRVINKKPLLAALGQGDAPYGLVFPVGVATDAKHRVWITDSGTASVHVFNQETGAYREFKRAGEVPWQQPSGIAADAQGRMFIADAATGGLYAWDEFGEYDRVVVKPSSHTLTGPTAVALSENGKTIFVADPPKNVIVALNREGEVDSTIKLPPELADASAISVIANQVCVLGGREHRVGVFSPAGFQRSEMKWESIQFPTAFAYDAPRHRIVVANPRWMIVEIYTEDGQNLGAFGQLGSGVDQALRINSLYVDPQGLVYLVDSQHGKVVVFGDSEHH